MKRRESRRDAGDFDRFGGWMGKRFEAMSFFRVEKDD